MPLAEEVGPVAIGDGRAKNGFFASTIQSTRRWRGSSPGLELDRLGVERLHDRDLAGAGVDDRAGALVEDDLAGLVLVLHVDAEVRRRACGRPGRRTRPCPSNRPGSTFHTDGDGTGHRPRARRGTAGRRHRRTARASADRDTRRSAAPSLRRRWRPGFRGRTDRKACRWRCSRGSSCGTRRCRRRGSGSGCCHA